METKCNTCGFLILDQPIEKQTKFCKDCGKVIFMTKLSEENHIAKQIKILEQEKANLKPELVEYIANNAKKTAKDSTKSNWIRNAIILVILAIGLYYFFKNKNTDQAQSENTESSQTTQEIRAVIDDKDGFTNLREQPNSESNIVAKVFENEVFIVKSMDGNWWEIELQNGVRGFMHKSRIKIQN